ncbi:alginate export family protein [Dysgonomonas massiliensis]|uniref:alginate export family protein n=1 Tax=Dysgonomonas massiliensis TaxID=2040292 RepID=UPI000C75829C
MKLIKNILMGLALIPFVLSAQEEQQGEFSISAQIRARGEYRNGALFPRYEGENSASFINNRTRLTLGYTRSNLELRLSGQHVGLWGESIQSKKDGDFVLNEAWAKLNFGDGFFAQLGRQALSYDDERILGGLDWHVAGRYHDLLKLGYSKNLNTIHVALAFNQNSDNPQKRGNYFAPTGQPYKNMQMAWYHYGSTQKPFGISLLAMNLGWELGDIENAKNGFMQTFGTYLTYKKDMWDLNGSAYYQSGKSRTGKSVSAYMASVFAKANFTSQWAVGFGSDYLSGSDQNSDKHKAFDPLYGTHHKFYGTMDYFYASTFSNGLNPGLWDNQVGIYYKPSPKVDMSLNYHYFMSAKSVTVEEHKFSKGLGSEVDFQINWSIMPDVKLMAGYSFMLGTKSMDVVKGGNHKSWQDWGWISINITPNLFKTKVNKF